MDRSICVNVDLEGAPHFVGYLWVRQNKGHESASFGYAKEWLSNYHNAPMTV